MTYNIARRETTPANHSFIGRLQIVYRQVGDLKANPKNPRQHSTKQIQQIADSIRAFGFNVPLLIDSNFVVIAGHGRLLACPLLGIDVVPTIMLASLTPQQVLAFMIADNRLTENATWDQRLLAEQFQAQGLRIPEYQGALTSSEKHLATPWAPSTTASSSPNTTTIKFVFPIF